MNHVNVIAPGAYKLKKQVNGNFRSVILDEELDPFHVELIGEDCIQIETNDMAYITLSIGNLLEIIELIEKAELKYFKRDNK
jgi:hypothetical protein